MAKEDKKSFGMGLFSGANKLLVLGRVRVPPEVLVDVYIGR